VVVAIAPQPSGIVRIIAIAGTLAAGYALAFGDQSSGRLEALGLNPNYLGGLLALPCVTAAGLGRGYLGRGYLRRGRRSRARRSRHGRRQGRPVSALAWPASVAVCLVAIIATQSRGAFLSAAVGIAVVVVQGRARRPRVLLALAAGVLAACALVAAGGAIAARQGGLGVVEHLAAGNRQPGEMAYDTSVRADVAEFAVTVAVQHPIRGIGFGMFPSYAASAPNFGIYMATHDDYLRLATEAGAIALTAFLVLLWRGIRGRRSGDLAVLRAVTVAYGLGLIFANPLTNLLASLPFWLSLGCLLATPAAGRAWTSAA
jgi:O-antigen ligase